MLKHGGKASCGRKDGKDPKTEPEAKKSKAGAKENGKEAAGEGPVLYEESHPSLPPPPRPHREMGKPCPVANWPCSRSAPGMWVCFEPRLRRKVERIKEEAPDTL